MQGVVRVLPGLVGHNALHHGVLLQHPNPHRLKGGPRGGAESVHLLAVGGAPCVGVGGLWVLHIPGKQGTGEICGGGWGVGGPLRGCGARLTLFWSSARPPHQGGWNVVTGRAGGVQGGEGGVLRVAVGAVTWQGARRWPLG